MIDVQKMTKKYGERVAVNDISFSVKKGEVLGFLGQNGAGKTTTMKVLTGFMAATSGSVSVAGFDVFEHPIEVKKRIGYLPETPPLYPELLVSEYLSFVADLRQIPKKDKAKRIRSVIERCQLGDVRNRLVANLSKGYRQRVGLAQALIHEPEVVILDEPTIGLDPKQVSEARNLIKSMRGEKTVIYSTHILSEVAATCDRILIINRGQIVAQEAISSFGAGTRTKTEVVVKKATQQMIGHLKKLEGVHDVQSFDSGEHRLVIDSESNAEVLSSISTLIVEHKAGLIRMAPVMLALEDYYLRLISGEISEKEGRGSHEGHRSNH